MIVIILLALCWVIVLVPSFVKPRFESSPLASIGEFERSMGILASTRHGRQHVPGRWVMVPKGMRATEEGSALRSRRQRVVQRRRRAFVRLLAAALATLVLGLIPGLRALLMAHVVLDVALGLYVLQLRRWRTAELERARVVRALPRSEPLPQGTDEAAG